MRPYYTEMIQKIPSRTSFLVIMAWLFVVPAVASDPNVTMDSDLALARKDQISWATQQFNRFNEAKTTESKFAAAFPFLSRKPIFEKLELKDGLNKAEQPIAFVNKVFSVVGGVEKSLDRTQLAKDLSVELTSLPRLGLPITVPSASEDLCKKSTIDGVVEKYGSKSVMAIMAVNALYIDLFRLKFSEKLFGKLSSKTETDKMAFAYYSFFTGIKPSQRKELIDQLNGHIQSLENNLVSLQKDLNAKSFPAFPLRIAEMTPECLHGLNSKVANWSKR